MAKNRVKRKQKVDKKTAKPGASTILGVSKHSLIIPAGAVDKDQEFTFEEPSSIYIRVRIQATNKPGYQFRDTKQPVLLTLSYEDREKDPTGELFIYETDGNGNPKYKLTENHKHDPNNRTVTARLRHLTGYVIAT